MNDPCPRCAKLEARRLQDQESIHALTIALAFHRQRADQRTELTRTQGAELLKLREKVAVWERWQR